MSIKELIVAIVVAHVVMELAKFVGAFVFYMVFVTLCEMNEEFCKHHLDHSSENVRHIAQKVYKRKWEPLNKPKEECEKIVVGFDRFTIDG